MKPTQAIDLIETIRTTIVSFVSILMFVALGVAVFLGISWVEPGMKIAADNMFSEGAFHNFQIQYPYGLTQDDINKLLEVDGVTKVEPAYQSFQMMRKGDNSLSVKVISLGTSIDTPFVVEGELPKRPDELAFHASTAEQLGVKVGDTITFEKDAQESDPNASDAGMTYLENSTFRVAAIVKNADYISHASGSLGFSNTPSGRVDGIVWVIKDAFNAEAFQNGYPVVNVACDGLAGKATFSDDYKQASQPIQKSIEELGKGLATARYNSLHGEAQRLIDENQTKLDQAEADIASGEKEVADGEKKLQDGRAELEKRRSEGKKELDDAYAKLQDGEAQRQEGQRLLNEATAKVNEAQQVIADADATIDALQTEITNEEAFKQDCDYALAHGQITQEEYDRRLDDRGAQVTDRLLPMARQLGIRISIINHATYGTVLSQTRNALAYADAIPVSFGGTTITLAEARNRLETGKNELASAQATYDQQVATLEDGWRQYNEGLATYDREVAQAEQQIADGQQQLEDAKRRIADGKSQVAKNKPVLDEAKALLAKMEDFEWTVLPRAYNGGAVEVSVFSKVTHSLSISMAALFIVVGLLVSYCAVSRIVNEQKTLVGTKKALGLSQKEITGGFLWYAGIATVIGCVLGTALGFFVVEGIINSVVSGMFAFGAFPSYFGWDLFLIVLAIELVLVLGTTYLACRKILKQHAVDLLRGEEPPAGKARFYEHWAVWKRLPLLIQVMVNNCVNDVRRAVNTIVGVAGCTALIVTAITLNNDVMKSYDVHYQNVFGFNAIAYVDSTQKNAAQNVQAELERQGFATTMAYSGHTRIIQPNGESGAMHLIVPMDNASFARMYHLNLTTGGTADLSGDGAYISQAYAEHLGAKVGDSVVIDSGDGKKHEIPILGFYEFWLSYNEMIVSRECFEKEFGAGAPNVVYCQTGDTPITDVEKRLASVQGFSSMDDDANIQYGNFATFSRVSSAVVIIYLVLAVLMAIVVLLNLDVMFIQEKKRELIVLMINGFGIRDARHYISYDTCALTAVGIVAGVLLGMVSGTITVSSVEPITGVFVKDPDGMAVVVGIVGSAVLALIMALIALRRINNFKLTDINRF